MRRKMQWYNDAIEVAHMPEQVIEIRFTMPVGEVSDEHKAQAERYARQAYVLSLLRQGDVSAGRAAEVLGINRWQLADLISVTWHFTV